MPCTAKIRVYLETGLETGLEMGLETGLPPRVTHQLLMWMATAMKAGETMLTGAMTYSTVAGMAT